jgi:hypothetical protein
MSSVEQAAPELPQGQHPVDRLGASIRHWRSAAAALRWQRLLVAEGKAFAAERLHRLAGVEVRLDMRQAAGIAHLQHQYRHRLAETLRNAAHGILGSRAVLHAATVWIHFVAKDPRKDR